MSVYRVSSVSMYGCVFFIAEQSTESDGDTSESVGGQSEARPLRKSARLRGRYPPREEVMVSPKKEVKKEVLKEEEEEEEVDTTPAATQEPDTNGRCVSMILCCTHVLAVYSLCKNYVYFMMLYQHNYINAHNVMSSYS